VSSQARDDVQDDGCRVVHCFRTPVGGLFRHVRDLIRGQARVGLQVGVICDSSTGGTFAEEQLHTLVESCELGILRTPIHRLPHPGDLRAFREAVEFCRAGQPSIIHGHGAKGGSFARVLSAARGAVAVYTPHGGSLHYDRRSVAGFLYLTIERLLARYTEGYVFESEFSAREFVNKIGEPAVPRRVVHNGLTTDELVPVSPSCTDQVRDFVFVGELRALKGVETLLDAVDIVRRKRRVSVLIAGAGPDEAAFRSRADRLNLGGTVEFSPPIHPATTAFALGRCLVVPSWAESFPYIVLEAAGASMPMLATHVGGIPEIYGSERGRLLPPKDPEALAAAMLMTLDDLEQARKSAATLHDRVTLEFRCENMVEEITEFYMSLQPQQSLVSVP